jgi:biotin transporter BioY
MEKLNTMTMLDVCLPQRRAIVEVALVLGFALMSAAGAQIGFWVGPVPITGQTFAVLLAGALLGSRRAAASQLSYMAIGLTGVPFWFAPGGAPGIARLLGPTGGYLLGFVAAAFLVGWLAERGWDRKIWTASLAMLAGMVVIYICGLMWLGRFLPAGEVLSAGLFPFILGDLIKLGAAALTMPAGWRLIEWVKARGN